MAKLKTYTLGGSEFINDRIRCALDLPPHIRQASVIAIARDKAQAARVLNGRGFTTRLRDPEFRLTRGGPVSALDVAGLLAAETVLVAPMMGVPSGDWVVRVDVDRSPRRVGRLMWESGAWRFVAEVSDHG